MMKIEKPYESKLIHISIVALSALLLYLNALSNGFSVDDFQFVVNNPAVHSFSWQNLKALFTSVPNRMEYLPVKDLTYILDLTLSGMSPFALHFSNVFWYMLACIAFFLFLTRLLDRLKINAPLLPLVAALIFVVHPMHTASVASICQRKDLVSALLIFAAMTSYLNFRISGRKLYYLAAFLLFIMALLAKATVMTVPLFILALDLLYTDERGTTAVKHLLPVIPFFIGVAIFIKIEHSFLLQTGVISQLYSSTVPLQIRSATAVQAFFYYLKLLVWPYPLLMIHDFSFAKKVYTPVNILCGTGLITLSAVIWWLRQRAPLVTIGAIWLMATLLPVVGLIPSNTLIAERYLFLPLAGYALILAACWQALSERNLLTKRLAILTLVFLLAAFSTLTIKRNPDWRDNLTLLIANARDLPGKAGVYYQIGNEYFALGEFGNALDYLGRAKAMNPLYRVHYAVHTAAMAYQSGNLQQAKADLDGIDHPFKMQFVEVNYLYGKLRQSAGDLENAAIYYRNASKATIPVGLVKPADIAEALKSIDEAKKGK
ncbi:MAG: hypothetical protein HXX17_09885 [Geobacteraceae bacterium]|nr:hypothetical protein [Geobacteraceae bacterium]